jgi:hypothetical protein
VGERHRAYRRTKVVSVYHVVVPSHSLRLGLIVVAIAVVVVIGAANPRVSGEHVQQLLAHDRAALLGPQKHQPGHHHRQQPLLHAPTAGRGSGRQAAPQVAGDVVGVGCDQPVHPVAALLHAKLGIDRGRQERVQAVKGAHASSLAGRHRKK